MSVDQEDVHARRSLELARQELAKRLNANYDSDVVKNMIEKLFK